MRKQVGGGMRQAGVLAAACHGGAGGDGRRGWRRITPMRGCWRKGLAAIDGIELDPATVETNIVYFDVTHPTIDAPALSAALAASQVLINPTAGRRLRAVTNYHVSKRDVELTIDAIRDALGA
jgi:threonine aldolase